MLAAAPILAPVLVLLLTAVLAVSPLLVPLLVPLLAPVLAPVLFAQSLGRNQCGPPSHWSGRARGRPRTVYPAQLVSVYLAQYTPLAAGSSAARPARSVIFPGTRRSLMSPPPSDR